MIERVWRQVTKVLGDAVVATDDSRILKEVERFGGRVVMTSESHRSGTDRCFEAYRNCGSTADVIINIQGDEPFIHEQQIEEIMQCFNDDDTQIATLARKFDKDETGPRQPQLCALLLTFGHTIYPQQRNRGMG